MKLNLYNIDEFTKDLPKITNTKLTKSKGKYAPKSLFSEQIFGPESSWVCQCGIQKKVPQGRKEVCPVCGVEYTDSSVRRERWAKIELPIKLVNPFLFKIIKEKYNKVLNHVYLMNAVVWNTEDEVFQEFYDPLDNFSDSNLLKDESESDEKYLRRMEDNMQILLKKDGDKRAAAKNLRKFKLIGTPFFTYDWYELRKDSEETMDEYQGRMERIQEILNNRLQKAVDEILSSDKYEKDENGHTKLYNGVEYLYHLIYMIIDSKKEKEITNGDKVLITNKDIFFIHNIPVLPADLRPIGAGIDLIVKDPINDKYVFILNKVNSLKENYRLHAQTYNNNIKISTWRMLQMQADELFEYIRKSLSGKEGLIRKNILGKRVDFSGRTVITVDPTLPPEYIKLPYIIALELFKLEIYRELSKQRGETLLHIEKEFEKIQETKSEMLFDLVQTIAKDRLVFLNRQPTFN
jgi:DNA-directed RNA polymerase subunit beta'